MFASLRYPLPSKDRGESIEVSLDHLLPRGRRIFGEFHNDQPVVVIAARQHNRLLGIVAAAAAAAVDGHRLHDRSIRRSNGWLPSEREKSQGVSSKRGEES